MNNFLRKLNMAFLACSLLCSGSAAFSLSSHGGSQKQIEDTADDYSLIALIPSVQRAGTQISEVHNNWMQIPTWLAGTWCTVDDLAFHESAISPPFMVPNINLRIMNITVQGTQRDRRGRIWQYIGTPFVHKVEYSDWLEEQVVTKVAVAKAERNQLSITNHIEITDRDKVSGNILEKFNEKAKITYQLIRDGEVKVTTEFIDTSLSGVFLGSRREQEYQLRMAPFNPINSDSKNDYRAMFIDFMNKNHPGEL
ncbi:MAG TPA: hypothetical protein V6C97_14750 [Oculatellaceae cyanobacterium]